MAVPKKKHSRARRDRRRAHWKAKGKGLTLVECPRCHESKRPHHICANCGYYKGRAVISE